MADTLTHPSNAVPNCGIEIGHASGNAISIPQPHPEGFRAWLPALVVLISMPLLALTTTKYVLLPPVQRIFAHAMAISSEHASAASKVVVVPLIKSSGTFTSDAVVYSGIRGIAVVVANDALKDKVVQNQDLLTRLAASTLGSKSASDLDNPSVIRSTRIELLEAFNKALGGQFVQEVYIVQRPQY